MSKKKSSSSDLGIGGGKGDAPRNCFSKKFRDNYDAINWHRCPVFVVAPVPKDFQGTPNDLINQMIDHSSLKYPEFLKIK